MNRNEMLLHQSDEETSLGHYIQRGVENHRMKLQIEKANKILTEICSNCFVGQEKLDLCTSGGSNCPFYDLRTALDLWDVSELKK
jgi:hypothetical protein